VGVYSATFGVDGQADTIKKVWTEKIDGLKLVNPLNFFTFGFKKILKLEYLENLFWGPDRLDIEKVFSSKIKIKYALINEETGEVKFIVPDKNLILKQMSAGCAVPFIHGGVRLNGTKYFDSAFIYGTAPFVEKIVDLGGKIVYVSNFPAGYCKYHNSRINSILSAKIFWIIGKFYSKALQNIYKRRLDFTRETNEYLDEEKCIQMVRPANLHLRSARDTNKARIRQLFDEGISAAEDFISQSSVNIDI
jgi:predicted patatin/cPLA2 family phospholipase